MKNTVPELFIDVPIRPITIGGVLFQRVTRYVTLAPRQDPETGRMTILLTVQVRHHLTNSDGSAGASAAALVKPYEETYRADNSEAVDLATGEVVLTRRFESDEAWDTLQATDERQLMGRGDAYKATMHAGPVEMVPQIRAAMAAADGPPFWRFGGNPDAPAS